MMSAFENMDVLSEFVRARNVSGMTHYLESMKIGLAGPEDNMQQVKDEINVHRNNLQCSLLYACHIGADEICKVLLSFGAVVNISILVQSEAVTPLYVSCDQGHPACVELLLPHGADVNYCDLTNMFSPLMAAFLRGTPIDGATHDHFIDNRSRCIRLLLDAGAKHNNMNGGFSSTWNLRLAQIALDCGELVNRCNQYGANALYFACSIYAEGPHVDVAHLLLKHGAEIDAVTADGWTPLHSACYIASSDIVDMLLRYGADVDLISNDNRTALHEAILNQSSSADRLSVLRLLTHCSHTRLEASLADWIRLANEVN